MKKNCEFCGKPFVTYPSHIGRGQGHYCSGKCYGKARSKRIKEGTLESNLPKDVSGNKHRDTKMAYGIYILKLGGANSGKHAVDAE